MYDFDFSGLFYIAAGGVLAGAWGFVLLIASAFVTVSFPFAFASMLVAALIGGLACAAYLK
jgi:hypothetical protein